MLKPLTVKETAASERPRERLLRHGVGALKTAELLAILIRNGRKGESAVQSGERIAAAFDHQLERLPAVAQRELKEISQVVGPTAYCQIMAGIELGRRVSERGNDWGRPKIKSTTDAMAYCVRKFARLAVDGKQEEFHIVTLDTKNQVIASHQITVGTLDASLVHPREVFRPAIKDSAASVLLVHNHPSGDPTPSKEDYAVTERLESAGKTIGIDILDHVIVTSGDSVSIAEERARAHRS